MDDEYWYNCRNPRLSIESRREFSETKLGKITEVFHRGHWFLRQPKIVYEEFV